MLMPKKVKYRKQQKGKMRGKAWVGSQVSFGDFGLKATECGYITDRQIEAGRARARFTRPSGGSGSGTVASLQFKGKKPGTSAVLVESFTITTPSGTQAVPVAGQGRVGIGE